MSERVHALVTNAQTAFISQQAAAGLERAGALAAYMPGMAIAEDLVPSAVLPWVLRRFPLARNRLLRGVSPWHVFPIAGPELLSRLGVRSGRPRLSPGVAWYDAMFALHDAVVARLPWPSNTSAIYAYEDGARASFERAKKRGLVRFYDLPIVYYRTLERIIRQEMETFPTAEPNRTVTEPNWKQRRKDAELELADVVVVASRFTKDSLEAAPTLPKHVEVVPYGFPTDLFDEKAQPPEGAFTVLAVGTQDLRKGTPYLLEAWKRAKLPNARLKLIGGMRLSQEFLRPYEGMFEHVSSAPRSALPREYRQADLLAFPTLGDGFGLVLQEAMCCGTPVVTTRCGGGPECIDHGKTGFIIEERSVDALVEIFTHWRERRGELFEMGRAARARAETWSPVDAGEATAEVVLRYGATEG